MKYEMNSTTNDVPTSFTASIYEGAKSIHRYRKKKFMLFTAVSLTAAISIILLLPHFNFRTDNIAAETGSYDSPAAQAQVFAAPTDMYYHSSQVCTACSEGTVMLLCITAEAFDMEPCPVCMTKQNGGR